MLAQPATAGFIHYGEPRKAKSFLPGFFLGGKWDAAMTFTVRPLFPPIVIAYGVCYPTGLKLLCLQVHNGGECCNGGLSHDSGPVR
jgi:hypothetical protein